MTELDLPKRYALLSPGGAGWSLVRSLEVSERHDLIDWRPTEGDVDPAEAWKFIRDRSEVEAVLVDADDDSTLESARQLAMRGTPLVVRAHASLPAEFVAEMSLYEAEGATRIVPWFDHRAGLDNLQDWAAMQTWFSEFSCGEVTSIHLERALQDTTGLNDLRRDVFLSETLLADIDLLRSIGGDYSQVTLIRTGGNDQTFDSQTLQLAGEGLPDATCTYRRSTMPTGLNLRIDTLTAHTEVIAQDDDLVQSLDGVEVDRYRPPAVVNDEVRSAQRVRILSMLDDLWMGEGSAATWSDLAHMFDMAEAMQRSLRRRRTIDLHFETTSERSQFKTQMSAIGCGVILWTMFGIIGLLLAGAVLDPRDGMQREAESAGFVLRNDEFQPDNAVPTKQGADLIQTIGNQLNLNESVVFIESSGDETLDESRIQTVRESLAQPLGNEAGRVVARPLRGQWFAGAMQIARIVVFAPVGVFLLFQVLLLIARPAATSAARDRLAATR